MHAYLWCPAYPLADDAARHRTLAAATALAERCGWILVPSPLLDRHPGPGAWLPAAERIADLRAGLACDVLLAARGGYGCLDLADTVLDWDGPLPRLVGYSDLTVLHACWLRRGRTGGIHGMMPGVPVGPRAFATTVDLAHGRTLDLGPDTGGTAVRPGRAEGPLVPACLRVLAGLAGTPLMPELGGRILAIEDIDERPYRLDRDLQQLWRTGALAGIRGLVFGRCPADLPPGYAGPSVADLAGAWAGRLGVPAVAGLPFGHDPDPIALPVGGPAALTVDDAGWRLTVEP